MLRYAFIFSVLALVAAVFGFGVLAAGAAGNVQLLFYACALLALVSLVAGLARNN